MKKNFKYYTLGWFVLLGLFNLLAFIIPAYPTLEKFTPSFWIGWGVTIGAFLGQLFVTYLISKEESMSKLFYNIPSFKISYSCLTVTFLISLIFMVITPLPYWTAAVACSIIVVLYVIAFLKAKVSANLISSIDEKTKNNTSFIYQMRSESEILLKTEKKTETINVLLQKICDAFKFSDPVGNEELSLIETDIEKHFNLLKTAVKKGLLETIEQETNEILALIAERNGKCKITK